MSSKCTILDGGPFHLFIEAQIQEYDAFTLSIHGKENEWSGGVFINKKDLVQFAKQVIHWDKTGEELPWIYEANEKA